MGLPILFARKKKFNPRQLFAALQGAWLEPVQGSIWQENTGVTPTTTGGQTIGKIADQSGGGNHAAQSVSGNRPLLGRRYNLLTYSEDFSNAAWTKRGTASITPNEAIAPDGTLTADKVSGLNTSANDIYNTDYQLVGAKYSNLSLTPLIWIKRISTIGQLYICNPYNTDRGQWNIDLSLLPDDWVKITQNTLGVTVVNQFTGGPIGEAGILIRAISGGPLSLYIWGADLRLTSDVGKDPAYQRITTSTDYDYGQYPAAVHDTTDSLVVSLPSINVRRNLLTWSESFDNAAWNKQGIAVVTKNTTLAPDGVSAASTVTLPGYTSSFLFISAAVSATTYTLSIYVKSLSGTMTNVTLNLYNNNNNQASSPFTVTTEWRRITWTFTIANAGTVNFYTPQLTGSGGSIYIWGAQLELGSTATDYQKITDWTSEAYSSSGSVYFATPVGMSALHNQSMATTYTLPALSTDIYSWIVVPQRLSTVLEARLERYMLRKANLTEPDYLLDDDGNQLMSDEYELLLRQ